MPSPYFLPNDLKRRDIRFSIHDLEDCNFNLIELRCPKCHTPQTYSNTFLSGKEFIVCDYCTEDIPMILHGRKYTVLARI